MSLHHHTLAEQAALLAAKKISSVELTQHYLHRIEKFNPALNAFITVDAPKTLAAAKAADTARAAGNTAKLLGLPAAQKDIFLVESWRTTCGSRMLENFVAPYTATVVRNMEAAGFVTLGKLNMDEFAMGSSNETSYFGKVRNPWDLDRVPGGSSGGSAAAVAACRARMPPSPSWKKKTSPVRLRHRPLFRSRPRAIWPLPARRPPTCSPKATRIPASPGKTPKPARAVR